MRLNEVGLVTSHLQPQIRAARTKATSRAANWLLSTRAQRLACPDVTAWERLFCSAIALNSEAINVAIALRLNILMFLDDAAL